MKQLKAHYPYVTDKLVAADLRPTRQRIMLGALLWGGGECRHVSAELLHQEAKAAAVKVSLATVYNTLHQFTDAGLLKEIVVDAGKSYFDTNTDPHHHFLHEDTGLLQDIPADTIAVNNIPAPPEGMQVSSVDVIVRVRNTDPAAQPGM